MAEESEEKNLPASQKKLADARKKGQTSNSKDLVSGFTMLAATLYLLYQWPMMRDRAGAARRHRFHLHRAAVRRCLAKRGVRHIDALVMTTVPLLVVVFAVVVVMGMAATGGPYSRSRA